MWHFGWYPLALPYVPFFVPQTGEPGAQPDALQDAQPRALQGARQGAQPDTRQGAQLGTRQGVLPDARRRDSRRARRDSRHARRVRHRGKDRAPTPARRRLTLQERWKRMCAARVELERWRNERD